MTRESSAPELSVISVNYKVAELVALMIESVPAAMNGRSYEIIIVDNASNDGSVEKLQALEGASLIASSENLGFAGGNNLGARQARGAYVALVNPDVVLDPGSLASLVDFLATHPGAGLVGPKILLPDGSTQSFAQQLPTWRDVGRALPGMMRVAIAVGRILEHGRAENLPVRCGLVHGACMVFPRPAFDAIGGVPTDTFMYGEELLLGHRLQRAGFEVWYDPTVAVHHQEESSAKKTFDAHARALRKRTGHVVARKQILSRPSFLAWNAVMAAREVGRELVAGLRRSGRAAEHRDFRRLHSHAIRGSRGGSGI